MFALISSEKIQLPPGAVVRLSATWEEYDRLCQQRGDGSIPRIKYKVRSLNVSKLHINATPAPLSAISDKC